MSPDTSSPTFTHVKNFAACWTRSRHTDASCSSRTPHATSDVVADVRRRVARGEALRLTAADVDLPNSLLTIRNTKFFKSRLVPINPDLTKVLSRLLMLASGYPSFSGRLPAPFSSANTAKRFTAAHWRVPSSDCGNMPAYDAPMAVASNLGCTTFGTPLRSTA